jgi:RNA polymerase sigma-70 factor (ECF subfamily)
MPERSNAEWLEDLSTPGLRQEAALKDLDSIVRRGLPYALSKWISPSDPLFNPLVEETTQETLLRVLDKKHTFEGRSKFTTWVHKIAVRIALTEIRRKRWRDVSLDEIIEESEVGASLRILTSDQSSPENFAMQSDMIAWVKQMLNEELTEKQRTALVAAQIQGMPLEEVANRMGMKRNALYKLLHDARKKLKNRIAEAGFSTEAILRAFESE